MLKRGHKYICMFLIYLVIVPIFFTASALAALTADATGYDGVAGFRRAANDVTILNASASISGKKVSASQLKMLQSPTKPFDCTEGNYSETVNCTMTISGDLYAGANTYDVELFNEDGSSTGERQSVTIYADDLAPKVHSFSMVRNGSAIDAVYQVSDSACDSCGADICAGISKVEFLLDGSDVGSVKGNGSCLMVNQTQLSVKPDNGTTTNKTICIDVYDRVGQHTSSCKSIVMDFTPPALINVSLWLDKNMIRYHKGVPMGGVTVKAYISEDSALNTSTLFANFSELSTRAEFRNAYSDIRMSDLSDKQLFSISCTNASNSSGVYLCTWTGLLIVLEEDTEPTVYLSVYDNLGNVLNTSYQIPVVYDKTAPEITDIRSGIADDRGRYWVGKGNNTIFVDVTETGSGLYDKKLFLDFSSFGPQPDAKNATTLFPNNCTSGWTCVFNNIIVTKNRVVGDALTVNVVGTSSDDAGNIVTGITTAGLYYDDVAPQVLNIINSSICPTAPGTIDLTVNVSEKLSGGVKAKVSAPNLSTSVFPQEVECEESEEAGIWTCDISIDNLVTIYAKDSINITLIDRANNTNTTVIPQEVCESAPGVPPNVVKSYATPIPQVLDKIIAGYIAYPVFAEIDFSYSNPPNQVQDIQISSCTADNATISEPYVVTPLEFSNPIIGMKVELDQQGVENATSLTVYCGLELIIRSGNKVYQQAEEENVSIDLELKGTIFGGLNESMQDKVADIEQQIADKQAEADEYETAIDVLGTICSIAEILAMLTALLQVVKILLYAVGWVVFGVVVIFAGRTAAMTAGSTIYYTGCYIIDYATTIVTTYAWQIDSNPLTAYDSPGFYLKLICAWFTCRLSETNNFIEMFLSSGSADGGDYTFDIDGDRSEGMPNDLESGVLSGSVMPAVGSLWEYDWNPYRSKHVASASGCLPGMKYNLLKEKQVLCMQRNCYRDAVSSGVDPNVCETLYKTHQCLYVDSAAWVMVGNKYSAFMQGLTEWLLTQLIGALLSMGLRAAGCGYPYGICESAAAFSLDDVTCGGSSRANLGNILSNKRICRTSKGAAFAVTNPFLMPQLAAEEAFDAAYLAAFGAEEASTKGVCGANIAPSCALVQGWKATVGCGPLVTTAIWLDVGDWIDWSELDWNMYDAELEGDDFCG